MKLKNILTKIVFPLVIVGGIGRFVYFTNHNNEIDNKIKNKKIEIGLNEKMIKKLNSTFIDSYSSPEYREYTSQQSDTSFWKRQINFLNKERESFSLKKHLTEFEKEYTRFYLPLKYYMATTSLDELRGINKKVEGYHQVNKTLQSKIDSLKNEKSSFF